jgi:hypothetical protein
MDCAESGRTPEGREAGSELKRRHTDHGMGLVICRYDDWMNNGFVLFLGG